VGEQKVIDALIEGGKATGGPPLGPALGPLGVNVPMIVNRINELTKDYGGMKVPVKVIVDVDTKDFEVEVGTPTTSALIVKELGIEKGSGNPSEEKVGNLTIDQIVKVAKMKLVSGYAKTLKACVREVLGVCQSMGVTVEDKEAKEVSKEVESGNFDGIA
jgi:large subunit ribosomal protein L11